MPECGQENPEGFRLCGMCGAALGPETVATREERKVVTVVFCDLVGFTAQAESLDPEEVAPSSARTTTASARSSSGTAARSRSSSAMR